MLSSLKAIIYKDATLELKSGAHLVPLIAQSILLVTFLGLGSGSFLSDERTLSLLFHPIIWAILILCGALTINRVFESDLKAGTTRGFLLYGAPLYTFYLAKCLFCTVIISLSHIISSLLLSILLNVSLTDFFFDYIILSILVITAYSGITTLLASITLNHSNRFMILPLISLPLLFPLFFSVLEVSLSISIGNGLAGAGGWLSLIIALAATYLILGILLIDSVVKE